ncbi:MAG: prolyl oligopeptidase family serine peptidase [Leptolyngbyaceae cyanobacterium bins.59]|nr:prolyl oligopeptidase family serine peptidase [Leptolyngbyaceae cyanobacterium bins.59]
MKTAIISGLTLLLSISPLPLYRATGVDIGNSPASSQRTSKPPKFAVPRPVRPDPIVIINPTLASQEMILPKEDVDKIARLQNTFYPRIVSDPSPDGKTLVIEIERLTKERKQPDKPSEPPGMEDPEPEVYQFLDIQTGKLTAIPQKTIAAFEITDDFRWRNADVAITIAYPKDSEEEAEGGLLVIDRRTAKVSFEPLAFPEAKLSLSPGGNRILIEVLPPEEKADKSRKKRIGRRQATSPKPQMPQEKPEAGEEIALKDLRVLSLPDKKELYRFNLPPETTIQSAAWSPDASKLALVRTWEDPEESGPFANVGERLFSPLTRDKMGTLPPNENPNLQKSSLLVIDLATDRRTLRYAAEGGDRATFGEVNWSPDGQTLLTTMLHPTLLQGRMYPVYSIPQRSSVRFYDAHLRELHRLEQLGTYSIPGSWTFQGKFISSEEAIFRVLIGMDLQLYHYNRRSGVLTKLSTQSGSYLDYRVIKTLQGNGLVFAYSAFTHPPELYRIDFQTDTPSPSPPTALTTLNRQFPQQERIRADRVTFTLANGEVLEGRLLQAADAPFPPQNKPLIVWQEGGPYAEMTDRWSAEVETPYALLPNFGFPVLIVPLYGRYGFGERRFNALYENQNFGRIDIDAMAEIVKQTIDRGYTSPGKIGITGCSYGGYFTTQSLVRHPDLYTAASAQCSWIDILADWTQGFPGVSPFTFGSITPYDNPTLFQAVSPVYNAGRIETPVLFFKGDQDYLPISFDENLYWMIAVRGVPSRMVKFVDAGHGLFSQEYQQYAAQEMIEWFRTYLEAEETVGRS